MKNLISAFLLAFSATTGIHAQPHLLIIHGESGKFYVEHIVDAKENWYSVGRIYNISPKTIAPFNGTTLDKPLEIGQRLKIPLTAANFDQKGVKAAGESLIPVYHIIEPKEWMYHISTTYNKVPVATLEKWNHITGDQAKAGTELIVGYLKVKTSQSALASPAQEHQALAVETPAVAKKEDQKNQIAVNPSNQAKNESKTDPGPKKDAALVAPPATKAGEPAVMTQHVENPAPASNTSLSGHASGGFFSSEFISEGKSIAGQAATFKSTSGWQDGKYYALMNNVPVGTIIRVSSPATNKFIFAKVLGQLPDMKESAGLLIRISNAAAAEMGTGEGKFSVELKY